MGWQSRIPQVVPGYKRLRKQSWDLISIQDSGYLNLAGDHIHSRETIGQSGI